MSAEMKYVVFASTELGEQLVVFPCSINHNAMAEAVQGIRHGPAHDRQRVRAVPVAAGFTDGLNCYGRSESLNLDSRREVDTFMLKIGGIG